MGEKQNKKIFFVILSIILITVILLGASYAYWLATRTQSGMNLVDTLKCLDISLTDEANAINLQNDYAVDNEDGMKKEPYTFTITNTCTNPIAADITLEVLSATTIGHQYIRASLNNFENTNDNSKVLTSYSLGTPTILGATSYILKSEIYLKGNDSKTYDVRIWIDENTTMAQGMNKTLQSKIVVIGKPACSPILADYIIDLADDSEATGVYNEPVTDYRYEGLNVNNYISFNNELWRIIGVFADNTHGKTGKALVKIIRNDSIENYPWDIENAANWENSSLKTYLNGDYYHSINSVYKELIEEVSWKLGGYSGESTITAQAYVAERDPTVYSGRPTEANGYIGLMYSSDYGYSTSRSDCRSKELYNYETINCHTDAWLHESGLFEWTLTPLSTSTNAVWVINYLGSMSTQYTYYEFDVRPSLYLESNAKLISGDGSIGNPYTIGR